MAAVGVGAAIAVAAALSSGLLVVGADSGRHTGRPPARTVEEAAGTIERDGAVSTPRPAPGVGAPSGTASDSAIPNASAPGAAARGAEPPPVVATTVELAELGTRLVVPVRGVPADRLVDSFDDARGVHPGAPGGTRRHDALDILAPRGTPVVSAAAGRVLKLFDSRQGGLSLYAADASGRFVLLYAHLDRYAPGVREGMPLRQGETIAFVGATGNASPEVPHLHFAIARTDDVERWWDGTPVNPFPLLRR